MSSSRRMTSALRMLKGWLPTYKKHNWITKGLMNLNAINQDVIDQDLSGSQLLPHLSSTQLSQMMHEEPQPSMLSQQQGPLPDPDFIMSNRPIARPAPLTTCTKKGKVVATKKRKVAKNTGAASSKKKKTEARSGSA